MHHTNLDLFDPGYLANPYPTLKRLREEQPVVWDDMVKGWVVTRYADVKNILGRANDFSNVRIQPFLDHMRERGLTELAEEVKSLVEQRSIEMGHARALLGLTSRRQQVEVANLVAKKALSVRETEALVRRLLSPATAATRAPAEVDPDIRRLELELADKLGAKVAFQHSHAGKGKLVVSYNSLDELEGILAHIQ